ncbi:capping protein inhibiting regulator of actin dynamics isoform X2 [Stegostoma tigrinum]|uniref:capping protein inhibiting regulator of actin dynamics isoform X2 n=1 Tax=Stegostoma tigrinum TaxID=3053191 RepID=UPI00202AE634|nr:capping protein inhibiting regulator of actin dynamics isoform X2 [Stegostoma tigrinum]
MRNLVAELKMQAEKKKQGKFQPIRKLFGKKRRKVPLIIPEKINLKSSQSTEDVRSVIQPATGESEDELRSASINMETRALSHESVFSPEGSTGEGTMAKATSEENLPGKVQILQNQLAKNIKFGQHPLILTGKRMEDTGANSEGDQFLHSPLQQPALQESKLPASTTKVSTVRSSWPSRSLSLVTSGGTIESINLDAVPQSVSRLDNTAAKHKLSVKPRNQRISKKHGRLAQEMRSATIHEFDFALEEKETIYVVKDLKRYKIEEGKGQGEKNHLKDGKEISRDETKVLNKQGAEQSHSELEGQKRWEDEQQETEEQIMQEEDQTHYEIEKQKLNEEKLNREEQKYGELEEQKAHEEEQKLYEVEKQGIHEEDQKCCEMEKENFYEEEMKFHKLEDQKLHNEEVLGETEDDPPFEEEQNYEVKEKRLDEEEEKCEPKEQKLYEDKKRCDELDKLKSDAEVMQHHELMELEMKKEEQKYFEVKGLSKEDLYFHATENNQLNEEQRKHNLEEQRQQKETERQHDLKKQQREEESQKDVELLNQEKQQLIDTQEEEQRRGELRWKEVDQRQTMSSPFSFQVSSGEKQIIFQKVNLTPVTHPREAVSSLDVSELQASTKSSNGLSSSIYVPHTAILVTGAQLCGTAVDLEQIKDTACKTLLGFSEERKSVDLPPVEKPSKSNQGARSRIGKSKFNPEPSVEQARSSTLTEWATIRAKILKSSDERFQERRVHGRFSDDWTTFRASSMHSSLRKTLSANAKFSITPAWQKWADGNKINSSEKMNVSHKAEKQTTPEETVFAHNRAMDFSEPSGPLMSESIAQDATKDTQDDSHSDNHNIRIEDVAEGYKFAKDLPSFLVPSLPAVQRKEHSVPQAQPPVTSQAASNVITQTEGAMDTSPFGIKLRRTHYSLRFHCEQQGEQKRKKRYSAGDSMEGIPAFLASKEKEGESYTVSGKQFSYNKDNKVSNILKDSSNSISDISQTGILHLSSIDVAKHVKNKLAARSSEKVSSRPQPSPKPALAPKPIRFTPPPSPHNTLNKSADHKNTKNPLDSNVRKEDGKNDTSVQTYRLRNEEVETKDIKSFFPSINIPWRERADKKSDSIKKEKPVLQSRHSLDSTRLVDRVESSQPLWITLAMQKQKGFREQQASREERRQAREAKLAEKQTKENTIVSSSMDNKGGNHYMSTLQKSSQDEEKKIGSNIMSKVERRELLKKSATLPNSVTVEICDSVGSNTQVKELPKRFSTPDAAPVSVEPAWLALAKRKAKAWSDCPQIIK